MTTASILPFAPRKKAPALRCPLFDLDDWFVAQQANLGAVRVAQSIFTSTAHAMAEAQLTYLEQILLDVKAAVMGERTPETLLANIGITTERSAELAKEALQVAARAQRRIDMLVTQQVQASVDMLFGS